MKKVSEILERLQHVEVPVRCQKCGAVPSLVGKQYSTRCPVCGTPITVSKNLLASLKKREYKAKYAVGKEEIIKPKCDICKDYGFIVLEEQVDDQLLEFGYRCICKAGQNLPRLSGWPVVPLAKVMDLSMDEKKVVWLKKPER